MIEKMKKVSVLIKSSELVPSLNQLRRLGVLHISDLSARRSDDAERSEQRLAMIDRVIAALPDDAGAANGQKTIATFADSVDLTKVSIADVIKFCREIDSLVNMRREYREQIQDLQSTAARLEEWGEFSPQDFEYLHDNGISLIPALIPVREVEQIAKKTDFIVLKRTRTMVKAVFVGMREDQIPETAAVLVMPVYGLGHINREIELVQDHIRNIEARLAAEYQSLPLVKDLRRIMASDLQLKNIQDGMQQDGPVSWLTGFIPADKAETFRLAAVRQAWGLLIEDPHEQDQVPTKLRNNRLVNMIRPVFSLLGTVPGYREYDVSIFFLLFFTVFVAMIIGDAGYGALFLAAALLLHRRQKKADELVLLIYVLSLSTLAWGTLTGTWFGSTAIADLPFFRSLVIPQIASFPELFGTSSQSVSEMVMFICFLLGIIQLSLACIINLIRQFPELKAASQIGWLSLLIGLYALSLNLVLGRNFPPWGIYTIVGGLAMIVIFAEQESGVPFPKGVLKGVGGLFTTFLNSISAFSNIISYIRLFAVGMSSVAIASSFNDIASGLSGGIAVIAALLILVIGHGLNVIMGLLSVIVHGVRLNMLEFSGQLGMEWSGVSYEPVEEYRSRFFTDIYDLP